MMAAAAEAASPPLEGPFAHLRTRSEMRAEAERWYRAQLAEVVRLSDLTLAMVAPAREAYRAGAPLTAEHAYAVVCYRECEAVVFTFAAQVAVQGAVLTGRWPLEDEALAQSRCADFEATLAFIDDLDKVPVGFVDPPETIEALQ